MSLELEYSPPSGSRWKWHSKALTYNPWVCRLSDQRLANPPWPMCVVLYVDLIEGEYRLTVAVTDWRNRLVHFHGACSSALEAILEAERLGDQAFNSLMPDWVVKALAEGWRPPLL